MNPSESYEFHPPTINPYVRGLFAPMGLVMLAGGATLVAGGLFLFSLTEIVFFVIAGSFFILFSTLALGVAVWASVQKHRGVAFLASERPLVRWTYSPAEWERLRAAAWQDEGGDWKVQFGCLTALLALAGALAGALIGLDESVLSAILGGGIGLVAGGIGGGILGAVVAGGNHLGASLARARSRPGSVALARDEVYALGNYFKGDGQRGYLRRATLDRGSGQLHLEIQHRPSVRGPVEEAWALPVPPQMRTAVEACLPQLTSPERAV